MGHSINHHVYNMDVDKGKVLAEIERIAEEQGDGGYLANLTWHEGTVYHNRGAAEDAIERFGGYRGDYSDHAVLFLDLEAVKGIKAVDALNTRIGLEIEKRDKYVNANLVRDRKSAFIGCPKCGSKIAREYIPKTNVCPLCRTDLRSDTVKKRVQAYDERIQALRMRREAELQKAEKMAPVRWLVKFEFHC